MKFSLGVVGWSCVLQSVCASIVSIIVIWKNVWESWNNWKIIHYISRLKYKWNFFFFFYRTHANIQTTSETYKNNHNFLFISNILVIKHYQWLRSSFQFMSHETIFVYGNTNRRHTAVIGENEGVEMFRTNSNFDKLLGNIRYFHNLRCFRTFSLLNCEKFLMCPLFSYPDKATSNMQLDPDWPSILQICDLIRQNDCKSVYVF